MLLDNKTTNIEGFKNVFEFLKTFTEKGDMDIVSGYFSISGLAFLANVLGKVRQFRLILGNLTEDKPANAKIYNLLSENISIQNALKLSQEARKAVAFLKQENVKIKTVAPNFCHAKVYIYKDKNIQKNYYVLGSSNLTLAGLGLKTSSNVELNTALFNDTEVGKWFKTLWEHYARDYTYKHKEKVDFKKFLIEVIENFYQEFTPFMLYYKTLFELFKHELPELEAESIFQQQIKHLKNTILYNALFPFQKKGVLSLIRMIQQYNGAILADAVGLGKTWQALAVMKFFQLEGYEIVLLCPKKLAQNWLRYKKGHHSKFEADRIEFVIRYHTDLQDDRLENKEDRLKINTYFQKNPKVLFVIDESHNLRNDKSSRYKFLVDVLLRENKDVKILLLSATPINNHLSDVRNQFKLIVKGEDTGFADVPDFGIKSLKSIFGTAQKEFNIWQKESGEKNIQEFISKLPAKMFDLTDKLIVARTRKIIATQTADLHFPDKLPPDNIYMEVGQLGKLSSFASIFDALKINMTAYRPTEFTDAAKADNVLEDDMQREKFLAKMMYILLVKRLESSWHAFNITVDNIYQQHKNALDKVEAYLKAKKDSALEINMKDDEDDLEDTALLIENQNLGDATPKNDNANPLEASLGKRKLKLSDIANISAFKEFLQKDIQQLQFLKNNIDIFKKTFDLETTATTSKDPKLAKIMHLVNQKQQKPNKKVVIFTAFKDTAQYLYDQFKKRGFTNLALITGSYCDTDLPIKFKPNDFEPLLEAFAPYTKLYVERDWSAYTEGGKFLDFDDFKQRISEKDKDIKNRLDNPINILIATDCISEGQNLQDCDWVINYDIHWNPVRLIQRFGRIDRIGSPNKVIKGINFWPGKNYDEYLKLKGRVEDRMALFSLVGSEFDPQMTPELAEKVKDNPLITRQVQNVLKQLQTTWDDIDVSDQSFGFDKLSLEEFRQDLFDFINANRREFEKIPNGVFTGFKLLPDLLKQHFPKGIIALLRYNPKDQTKMPEKPELHLLYVNEQGYSDTTNQHEILSILRKHKMEVRFVPEGIDKGNDHELHKVATMLKQWLDDKAGRQTIQDIQTMFAFGIQDTPDEEVEDNQTLEEKFQSDNFELITWFILS